MKTTIFSVLLLLTLTVASAQKNAFRKNHKREKIAAGEKTLVKPEKPALKVDTAGMHNPTEKGSGMTTASDNPPDKLDRTNQGEIPQLPASGATR